MATSLTGSHEPRQAGIDGHGERSSNRTAVVTSRARADRGALAWHQVSVGTRREMASGVRVLPLVRSIEPTTDRSA
ncbi:hypothetical protein [Nocardia goodfellowii]|uniref:Uncharacterized protein n=1 Tax=Nocardia goodfellowii TaxID=882446 RepID=A0ABS4QS60_9NOCA|nr:hypothetical protein [Nocardia goodfellowii]MBP2194535.1 hypothetical protein [Nocardia goodfellowii]